MSDLEETGTTGLATLLSQVLVAFTIEFDNEAEHRIPHQTTARRSAGDPGGGPWLVSLAMWAHFLQFVAEDGMSVREFCRRARLRKPAARIWLTRLVRWWRYLDVGPHPGWDGRSPERADWIVVPTAGGLQAQRVWRELFDIVEERWRIRFTAGQVARLRELLATIVAASDAGLPYLPIVAQGFHARVHVTRKARPAASDVRERALPTLLAQTLLAFTLEFESESELSLAMSANALRVISEEGVRERDLPGLSGVSQEALAMSLGFLKRGGYVVEERKVGEPRTKLVRLTAQGIAEQSRYRRLLRAIEHGWQVRFGPDTVETLRASLQAIVDARDGDTSPLGEGLRPYPDGWRARKPYLAQTDAMVRDPAGALPHYPMVLHRGGWPDGS